MKTYRLTTKFKLLSLVTPTLILLFFFKASQSNHLCFGTIALCIIFFAMKNLTTERLTLSDEGIEYHRLGLTFNTKWENVRVLRTRWFSPFEQEGIFLAADQFRITEWWINSNELGVWGQKAFIPLSKFSDNWRNTELGIQIKQYAPHLFEKEKSA